MAISDPCPKCQNLPCTCGYIGDPSIRWDTVEPYVWKKQRDALLAAAKAVIATYGDYLKEDQHYAAMEDLKWAVKEVTGGQEETRA